MGCRAKAALKRAPYISMGEAGGQWVKAETSIIPEMAAPSIGDDLTFSLPANDGAVYQVTVSGYPGSVDFSLSEE